MDEETDWTGFEQTRTASEAPGVEWLSDRAEDEDLAAGYSLLRQLAADPDSDMTEIGPQVYYQSKLRPDRDKLS